jgi:hypothetical protein
MNTIPELLRSYSTNHQDHRRRGVNVRTVPHANSGPSGQTSTDGIDNLGGIPSDDRRAEGLAEYAAQDADNDKDGKEPDRTKEVRIIQRAARRHFFKDTEEHPDDALTKGRNRLFRLCKASSNAVHAKYRKVYLGPVPHLLLCVEWIVTRAQESKDAAIKARRRVGATLQEKSDLIIQHKMMR